MVHPPLWARWVITIVVFAIAITAIAIIARSGGSGDSQQSEFDATLEANREGRIAIAQDEAPHVAALASGVSAQAALERSIASDVHERIHHGALTGPLQSVRCRESGPQDGGRHPFRCTVRSAGITYPFVGVLAERTMELTWCKVDPPPVANASLEVPVSARCRA
jgi:hypothetical protein